MFIFSDKVYEGAKRLVQVIIPAISSLYFGLANIWGLPYGEQVVGTLAILATFIGVCLGISNSAYKASGAGYGGKIVVTETEEGGRLYSLELAHEPEAIEDKTSITFAVEKK